VVAFLIVIAGVFYAVDFAGSSNHPGDKCSVGAVNPNFA